MRDASLSRHEDAGVEGDGVPLVGDRVGVASGVDLVHDEGASCELVHLRREADVFLGAGRRALAEAWAGDGREP